MENLSGATALTQIQQTGGIYSRKSWEEGVAIFYAPAQTISVSELWSDEGKQLCANAGIEEVTVNFGYRLFNQDKSISIFNPKDEDIEATDWFKVEL